MKTLSTYKRSLWRYILVALWLCGTLTTWGQTVLERGDVAILGVNTNNQLCGSNTGSDIISIVFLKDIETGTSFIMTDNGYGRINDGFWGSTEGTIRFTYEGLPIIPKGTVVRFQTQISPDNIVKSITPLFLEWNIEKLSDGNFATFNIGVNGDQIYILSSNGWDNGIDTHQATFNGEVYYGMTTSSWCTNSCAGTSFSQLHPDIADCHSLELNGPPKKYSIYKGSTEATTKLAWFVRINNPNNWQDYNSCNDYNLNDTLDFIEIVDSVELLSINPDTICEGQSATLSFSLPDTGYNYDVVYNDGESDVSLTDINFNHTISVNPTQTTTYSIVSISIHGDSCPIFPDLETTQVTLNVNTSTSSIFENLPIEYCEGEDAVLLPTTSDNGVEGTWSPASIDTTTLGTQTYTFTPNDACYSEASFDLTVVPVPDRDYIIELSNSEHNQGDQQFQLRGTYEMCGNDLFDLPLAELQALLAHFDLVLTSPTGEEIDLTDEYTDWNGILRLIAQMQGFVEEGTWQVQVFYEDDNPALPYSGSTCSWSGSLELIIHSSPDAGENATLTLCAGETPTEEQLFDTLGGSPEPGGTWSQNEDIWTYTIESTAPCGNAQSTVTVNYQALIMPTFSLSSNYCQFSGPHNLPTTSNNSIMGDWFEHVSGNYIPISEINTDLIGVQTLVFVPHDGQGCVDEYTTTVNIRDAGGIALYNGNDIEVPENIIVLGDNTNYVESLVPGSNGTFTNSDDTLFTIDPSTGLITTNNNGLIGVSTVTYTLNNGCMTQIQISIVGPSLPGGVAIPSVWMKADENQHSLTRVVRPGGRVSEWVNTMSDRAVTQITNSKRPSYIENDAKSFNYHRYIKFNADNQQVLFRTPPLDYIHVLNSTFFNVSTALPDLNSVLMTYRIRQHYAFMYRPHSNVETENIYTAEGEETSSLYQNIVNLNSAALGQDYYSNDVARIFGSVDSASDIKGFVNEDIRSLSLRTQIPKNWYQPKFSIGARDVGYNGHTEYSNDGISEIIIYGRVLSDSELQRVRTYLAIKYGISLNPNTVGASNDYIDSQSNLIFDPEDHVGFNHNISIVGRDNTGINTDAEEANKDLFQKQSRSVNDNGLLTLYVDNSVEQNTLFNSENSISMGYPNRNFFVIADNDEDLSLSCMDGMQRMNRVWKMTRVGNHPRVSIGFDPNELPEEVTTLLVSSDPSFPANNTSVLELNNYTGTGTGTASAKKGYIFDSSNSNLEDVPNGKYFTFGNVITPSFSFETSYCKGDTPVALPTTSENGVEGTWSPSSINTSQPGSYSYVFTPSAGNCGLPVTITVEITEDLVSFNNLNLTGHCVYSDVSLALVDDNQVVGHWEDADGNDLGNSFTSTTAGDVIIYFVPDTSQAGCYDRTPFTFTFISCPCPELEITIQATEPICAGSSIELTAIITGDAEFDRWETSGNGSFSNEYSNETTYTPSPEDILNNEVIITAFTTAPNTNNPNCGPVSDSETIIIISKQIAEFEQLEFNICEGEEFILPTPTNNVDGAWSPAVYSGEGDYVFTPTADCNETTTISVYEHALPQLDSPENVVSCTSYELPILTHGSYFTGTNGTGTQLSAGDVITSSQTIYVYAETGGSNNCAAETSFEITIVELPEVDILDDVIVCESYELPNLSHGNYYTEPDGAGTELNAGDLITSSQTIYIYAETGGNPNCSNESSFDVTIKQMAEIVFESLTDLSICGNMSLPEVDSLDTEDDNNVAGTWSVVENNNVYTYTFTPTNECYEAYSFTVSVEDVITPNFVIPPSQCEGESFPLENESPNGITGTWSPAFDPYNTTTYTFTPDAGQCASTQEVTIIIKDKPITSPIQLLN
ncbi:hypothetical protein NLM59_09390 [Weeksellaceae bacterium KMM 9724]|uniref:hypothetical protein n=1 Tax=Profundicola chukchiensis TaxID=2961959 RepID=UPI0024406493|nr:hypothetical protein [Profundicola chukchiensis]MDG4951140.1 hypothetical protein [Profundicola chukchiensis]